MVTIYCDGDVAIDLIDVLFIYVIPIYVKQVDYYQC